MTFCPLSELTDERTNERKMQRGFEFKQNEHFQGNRIIQGTSYIYMKMESVKSVFDLGILFHPIPALRVLTVFQVENVRSYFQTVAKSLES